jgi:hypothetical protein
MSDPVATLWSKDGGPPTTLPPHDSDATGSVWSDLANSPEGRAACGWAPASVPAEVTMAQARVALLNAGHLADVDAWVETQDAETQIYWKSSYRVRRAAPKLLEAAAAKGWSSDFLDALFIAAAAVP